jgi:hypothetical protein
LGGLRHQNFHQRFGSGFVRFFFPMDLLGGASSSESSSKVYWDIIFLRSAGGAFGAVIISFSGNRNH